MRTFLLATLLASAASAAQPFPYGRGASAPTPADVQAALVGRMISADSYTATTATGPAFIATNNLVNAIQLGTAPRATIGSCNATGICLGPNDGAISTMVYISGSLVSKSAQIQGPLDMLGVDAYLINNNGSDAVRVEDVDGFRINGTTPLKGRVAVSVTFDSAAISNNACNPQTVTVTGALAGDFVSVNANFALPTGVVIGNARVTSANAVELTLCNVTTGGTLDPASGPYLFKLER
jgi:hypothetical protein